MSDAPAGARARAKSPAGRRPAARAPHVAERRPVPTVRDSGRFGAAGNQAMAALAGRDLPGQGLPAGVRKTLANPGRPLAPGLRSELETRLGENLGDVRVHTDATAADSAECLNARAYTIGHDIVFARGRFAPERSHGRHLLAHELAHVIQQRRGGRSPSPDPQAAHERAADRAARAVTGGSRPVVVSGRTGVGLTRSIEDWLSSSPNIGDETAWSYSALLREADVIHQWLQNQNTSTPESGRLEAALELIKGEVARRERSIKAKPHVRRRARASRETRSAATKASQPATDDRPLEKPRVLRERTSVDYSDRGEIRREVDRIMRWLERDDLAPDDRAVLETELETLRPKLTATRVDEARARRQERIARALQPRMSGGGKALLVAAVRRIDEIKPLPTRPGHSYIMHAGEMIVLRDEEVAALRAHVVGLMNQTYRKVQELNRRAFDNWAYQARANREHPFAAWGVSVFGGSSTKDPFERMNPHHVRADNQLSKYWGRRRGGDLVGMAEALSEAADEAAQAYSLSAAWAENIQTTGSKVIHGLTLTRDLSAAIVTSYAGGSGFLALRGGMGAVKAAAVVTAAGAGGNAVFRSGTNLAGQAFAGGGIDFGEAWREAKEGAKQGTVNTVSAIATAGTANFLGEGSTLAGRVSRNAVSGFAGGSAAGATNAIVEGKPKEIVGSALRGGFQGTIGGVFGGGTQRFGGPGATAAAGRVVVGAGGSAAGAFLGELATGGSFETAKDAAIQAGVVGAVMASPRPAGSARAKTPKASPAGEAPPPRGNFYTDETGVRPLPSMPPVERVRRPIGSTPVESVTPAPQRRLVTEREPARFPDLAEHLAETTAPHAGVPESRPAAPRSALRRRIPAEFGKLEQSRAVASDVGVPELDGWVVTAHDFAEAPSRRAADAARELRGSLPERRPNLQSRRRQRTLRSAPDLAAEVERMGVPKAIVDEALRGVGGTGSQNLDVLHDIKLLLEAGADASSVRVDRTQVGGEGRNVAVGANRPDVQATIKGRKVHIEYDRFPMERAHRHAQRIIANDPSAIVILKGVGF